MSSLKHVLILLILSYAFFFFGNSFLSLTDPDEVFYSLTAKEMAEHNTWMVPYIFDQPQFEKPIFTYWMLRLAFDWWGQTPFVARFFPALFATLGVLAVYCLGLLGFNDRRKAFWSAVVIASSALFAGMAKTVFTDTIFTVFILLSLLSFYWAYVGKGRKAIGILLFFAFGGLATLTKGPLGMAIPAGTVILFLMYRGQLNFLRDASVLAGLLLCLAIALPWYMDTYHAYGQAFIQEFFYNDHWRRLLEAEHKGNDRWFFYPLTMIMGLFPWSLFFIAALAGLYNRLREGVDTFGHFLLSWIIVTLLVFQPAHSKLASYILPLFPALALLTGGFLKESETPARVARLKMFLGGMAAFFGCLGIGVVLAYGVYAKYLSSMLPVYFLSALLIALAAALVIFILRDKITHALAALTLSLMPFLWTAFLIKGDLEPYVSSAEACNYIPHDHGMENRILASKPYARGVRYYTGHEVAVMNINGGNYFSAHPVPIISKLDQLADLLRSQGTTYGVLKKGAYRDVTEHLPAGHFKTTLLKQVGYNYVVKIESLPQT